MSNKKQQQKSTRTKSICKIDTGLIDTSSDDNSDVELFINSNRKLKTPSKQDINNDDGQIPDKPIKKIKLNISTNLDTSESESDSYNHNTGELTPKYSNASSKSKNKGKPITCRGCLEDQPNQLAHMEIGGCMYEDFESEYGDDENDNDNNDDLLNNMENIRFFNNIKETMNIKYPSNENLIEINLKEIKALNDKIIKNKVMYTNHKLISHMSNYLGTIKNLEVEKNNNEILLNNMKRNLLKKFRENGKTHFANVKCTNIFEKVNEFNSNELYDFEFIIKKMSEIKKLNEKIIQNNIFGEYWKYRCEKY
jgi:hypothetical protein